MIAYLPVAFIWDRIPDLTHRLARVGLSVLALDGTIWQGRAHLRYQTMEGILSWDLDFWSLPRLRLPIEAHLDSSVGAADMFLLLSRAEQIVRIQRADIDLAQLSPLLRKERITLDGRLMVLDLEVMLVDQVIDNVAGQVSWSGGTIGYPVGRQVRERRLQEFRGLLTMKENIAHFGLREAGGNFDVIDATLNPEGELLARVKGHLFTLADENLPGNYQPQDDVFKVKKKILPIEF